MNREKDVATRAKMTGKANVPYMPSVQVEQLLKNWAPKKQALSPCS